MRRREDHDPHDEHRARPLAAGLHYYAMALLAGGDLKARIRAHPRGMPPAAGLAVAAALARALGAAHARGIVHRDVKPENVLFTADGAPQLTDFGIAHAVGAGARMTATGMSVGTPHYMSPEQAQGAAVDGRSDVYSLGVVLYEMLTGKVPYDSDSGIRIAISHIRDPVPVLPASLGACQPLLNGLLAKSPSERYASGEAVAQACEALPRDGRSADAPSRGIGSSTPTGVPGAGGLARRGQLPAAVPSRAAATGKRALQRLGRSPLAAVVAGALVGLAAVAVILLLP